MFNIYLIAIITISAPFIPRMDIEMDLLGAATARVFASFFGPHLAVAEIQRSQPRGVAQHRQVPRELRSAEVQHFQVLQATQRRAQLPGHVLAATCAAVL